MMTMSAREISNELSRHAASPSSDKPNADVLCQLVELLSVAPAHTAEDAMAFLVWATGFLKEAMPTMPDAEAGDLTNPKYLVGMALVLASRSMEALEAVTGLEAATVEGDVRRRN